MKEKLIDFGLKTIIAYKTGFLFYNMTKFLHERIGNAAQCLQKVSRGNSLLGILFLTNAKIREIRAADFHSYKEKK